jgi:hypothetical protein
LSSPSFDIADINSDEWRELADVYPHDNPTIMENPGEWNVLGENNLFIKSMSPFLEQMGVIL